MKTIYSIYGAGGFAREVMPLLKANLVSNAHDAFDEIVFIEDNCKADTLVNDLPLMTFETFLNKYENHHKICTIAIADSVTRRKLTLKCEENNICLSNVSAENAIVMDKVVVGEGAILSPYVTVTSNVKIGKSFHANLYSYVAHDCVIGDFVTFGPAVKCNGNVVIEDDVYVGTGAIILPGTKEKPRVIGKNSIIGAGAVVTKDVPANTTVIGNPARPFKLKT